MKKYIYDLDNTLVYSNYLNNYSYNYALKVKGIHSVNGYERITRDVIIKKYPELDDKLLNEIIQIKQLIFLCNLKYTKPNLNLIEFVKSGLKDNAILWTSGDRNRVISILRYYDITNCFKYVLFSNKENISEDIIKICSIFNCTPQNLVFFEDNIEVINKIKKLDVEVLKV